MWNRSIFKRFSRQPRRSRRRRPAKLQFERLENRLASAVTSFDSGLGVLSIDLNFASEAVDIRNDGANISLGSTNPITGDGATFLTANVLRIVVTDSGNLASQALTFPTGTAISLSGGLDSTGVETVTFNNAVTASGTSSLSVTAPRNIVVGANITGGSGGVTLSANQEVTPTSGTFIGVDVSGATITTTDSGNVSVTGRGGDINGGNKHGVRVQSAGQITADGSGTVTVEGTGGASTGNSNFGVYVIGTGSQISSSGGAVLVEDTGTSNSEAVRLQNSGAITSGSNAVITITADSANILAGSGGINSGMGTTTIQPRTAGTLIDLGGADVLSGSPLTLGLTSAELNQITAGTLIIGNADSGTLSITANVALASSTDVELHSGGDVVFDGGSFGTGGGTLLLSPGPSPAAAQPLTASVDATASTVSFASGSDLEIAINGPVLDTDYSQLSVDGAVNLTGVSLVIGGDFSTITGTETFTIVSATSVVGTFVGLAQNDPVNVHGQTFFIQYYPTNVQLVP